MFVKEFGKADWFCVFVFYSTEQKNKNPTENSRTNRRCRYKSQTEKQMGGKRSVQSQIHFIWFFIIIFLQSRSSSSRWKHNVKLPV